MAIRSLSDLNTAIASFAWRSDDAGFLEAVPTFIGLAEERFNRELRVRWMEASAPVTITDGVGNLPDDYIAFRNATAGGCPIEAVEPTWMVAKGLDKGPFFTVIGGKIKVYAPGDVVLDYYQSIPPLGCDNQSNWLLKRAPSLYLYGSLLEASPFMIDDQRLSTWGSMFDKAMTSLINDDVGAKFANVQMRVSGPAP